MRSGLFHTIILTMITIVVMALSSGTVLAAYCESCSSMYRYCRNSCVKSYPAPASNMRCMANCTKQLGSCSSTCVCPSGTHKICSLAQGGAMTCACK